MTTQIRVFQIESGSVDAFVAEWRERVAPLRRRFGFEIVSAWASTDDDTFVWLLSHDGDFEQADRAYYASPERAALDPDPARLIQDQRTFFACHVPLS